MKVEGVSRLRDGRYEGGEESDDVVRVEEVERKDKLEREETAGLGGTAHEGTAAGVNAYLRDTCTAEDQKNW